MPLVSDMSVLFFGGLLTKLIAHEAWDQTVTNSKKREKQNVVVSVM